MSSKNQAAGRRRIPLFYAVLAMAVAAATLAVVILNIYLGGWLREYEAAQPKYLAAALFEAWFGEPDFAALLSAGAYVLAEGETPENARAYFEGLAAAGGLSFCQVTAAFEEKAGALAYMVRAGEVNLAKFTLLPSGQLTKRGFVLYEPGGLMLIRRHRPAPPAPPQAEPGPQAMPEGEPQYSEDLQERFSSFVLEAAKSFSKRSRNQATKAQTLVYYEPGSDIYARINALSRGYDQEYESYRFEDEAAGEFLPLAGGAFSCRVRYTFIMKSKGQGEISEQVDYTLFLRLNENGKYLIYEQHVSGSPAIPRHNMAPAAREGEAALYLNGQPLAGGALSTLELNSGDTLALEAKAAFKYVYLIWDKPPAAAQLNAAGAAYEVGRHGFLHELITLDKAAAYVELTAGGDAKLQKAHVFGAGGLPGWVQQWQPPLAKADLAVFSTHADDEFLSFGGILPTYAGQRGLAVQVVYLTYHRPQRNHELLDGLWAVGVTSYPLIGPFADSSKTIDSVQAAEAAFGRERVLEFQVEMLRRLRPYVVVGHDLKGEYGHGAHILNAQTLAAALELSGNAAYYPQSAAAYGLWETPKAYLHLYAGNQIVMDWDIPLAEFYGKTAFEMAQEGFARHKSQAGDFAVQQSGTWQDCRKFGLYRSTVGPDIQKNDLFENLL